MAERLLPLLVQPEELQERLDAPGLLIVDVNDAQVYADRHLPGAINLPPTRLLRQAPPVMGLLPDADTLSQVLSAIGMRSDLHVVAYDDAGNTRASRLLWTLDVLGHFDYSLLDGGLGAWIAEGRPTESGSHDPEPSGYRADIANPAVVADLETVRSSLADDNSVVFDARSPAEYRGEDVRSARGGHVPGAVNLEWTDLIDRSDHGRLRPPEELRGLLKNAGVTPDKSIITHCQSHQRSALTFFVMRYLGYPRISGYAGSWSEWGNHPEVPVESSGG